MADNVEMKMADSGERHRAPRTWGWDHGDGSSSNADRSDSLVSQCSIDGAIAEESRHWIGTGEKTKHTENGLPVDINRDVFELLQICGGRQADHLELQAFMDIFNPELLLYDTKHFNSSVPSRLTLQELSARQQLLEKYLTFDLPEIYNPTVQKMKPFELSVHERRRAHIAMRQQEEVLMNACSNAAPEEKHVLGDAYAFCDAVNAAIIDPTLLEGAYEDIFGAFCNLVNLIISRGSTYRKKATVLGKEVTAVPDYRVLRKECFSRKPKQPGIVAVVEVKAKCQWDSNYELPRNLRPRGYEYTCNMRGQLLGDMLMHLDMSCCIAKPDDEEMGIADTFAIIGISVVATKVCFCLLEMPREQYSAIMVADKEQAYRYRIKMDELRRRGIAPAAVRYTDCLDMTSRNDRSELLKVLHMIGNMS